MDYKKTTELLLEYIRKRDTYITGPNKAMKLKGITGGLAYIISNKRRTILLFCEYHGAGEEYLIKEDDVRKVSGNIPIAVERGMEERFPGAKYVIGHRGLERLDDGDLEKILKEKEIAVVIGYGHLKEVLEFVRRKGDLRRGIAVQD